MPSGAQYLVFVQASPCLATGRPSHWVNCSEELHHQKKHPLARRTAKALNDLSSFPPILFIAFSGDWRAGGRTAQEGGSGGVVVAGSAKELMELEVAMGVGMTVSAAGRADRLCGVKWWSGGP